MEMLLVILPKNYSNEIGKGRSFEVMARSYKFDKIFQKYNEGDQL